MLPELAYISYMYGSSSRENHANNQTPTALSPMFARYSMRVYLLSQVTQLFDTNVTQTVLCMICRPKQPFRMNNTLYRLRLQTYKWQSMYTILHMHWGFDLNWLSAHAFNLCAQTAKQRKNVG